MKPKKTPVSTEKSEVPSRRPRFRIERLEERIAPKKGGKATHNCGTANCTDMSSGGSGY